MIKRKYLKISIVIALTLALVTTVSSTQASIGLPDYDSGWVSISNNQNLNLTHNLGTTEVLVYVLGRENGEWGINQIHYGIDNDGSFSYGVWFDSLTNTSINLLRGSHGSYWQEVRVRIWKIESLGVGGFTIPVDKFSLLAPYIALVSTIILAVSISLAIIKHRKKQ